MSSILRALSGGDGGRRPASTDVATASAAADRTAEVTRKTVQGRAAAVAELAGLRAQRPGLIISGDGKALDALERKITVLEREIERANLVMPELRRQGEAAGAELHAAKLAVHRERHRAAMGDVLAALAQLADANRAAEGVMAEAARDLGYSASPWNVCFFDGTGPGAVDHWRRMTAEELDRYRPAEVGPRMVAVRLLRSHGGFQVGEVGSFPKPEADQLVTRRGEIPPVGEFVDPYEQVDLVAAAPPAPEPMPSLPPPAPKPALVLPPPNPDGSFPVKFSGTHIIGGRVRGEVSGTYHHGEVAGFPRAQAIRIVESMQGEFHDLSADAAQAPEGTADGA